MSFDGVPTGCKMFKVIFERKTRPLYRKGKLVQESMCFVAHDVADCLRMAKEHAEKNYHRQKWRIVCALPLA